MATDCRTRVATADDAKLIAPLLRIADAREIFASSGLLPEAAIALSIRLSPRPLVTYLAGELAAVSGFVPRSLLDDSAEPWLLGTDVCARRARLFMNHSRRIFEKERRPYRFLSNYVDDRNVSSIRWLRWLGFKVYEPIPHGPLALPFRRFTMGVD